MPIDFEALRKKLGQLNGQNKKSAIMWRPEENKDYTVRVVAIPNNDGQPFVDRWYYYGIGGDKAAAILSPHQFGKRDPIQELITKLREEGTDASRELCKKLYPKMRTYAAVVVRGEEDKGVRLWSFGKMIYQDLLRLMLDEDYGDITDVQTGRDIKISVTKQPGKQFADTKIQPRANPSPLTKDQAQLKTWLSSIPKIDDYEEVVAPEEIERRVNAWLNGDSSDAKNDSLGTVKGKADTLQEDVAEIRSGKPSKPSGGKKPHDDIDDAFADLEDMG
jgi:hypothetical protein